MGHEKAKRLYMRMYYDSLTMGVPAMVAGPVRDVYDELVKRVWRSPKGSPSKLLNGSHKRGLLMARVSQSTVAAKLGMTTRTVHRHVSTLRALGWVEVSKESSARASLHYILGTVVFPPPYKNEEGKLITPKPVETTFKDAAVLRAFKDASVYADAEGVSVNDLPLANLHMFLKMYFVSREDVK